MITLLERLRPGHQLTNFMVTMSLAVLLIWFGLMNISGASASTLERWLSGHKFLSFLMAYKQYLMWGTGAMQALAGLLIALHSVPYSVKRAAYWFTAAMSAVALSLMFTNPVWIDSLGGFPAIGAGQGLIKYLTLLGLALHCLYVRQGKPIMVIGLILVLGWIGGMKFTGPEAEGVAPLLGTSPIFNWWLPVYFDQQNASNVIGVIELVTVLLLTGYWWNRKAFLAGLALSAATFIATLSFMISFAPSWHPDFGGFPYLSSTGVFLLKDLILLAAVFVLSEKSRI